jgi:hypothetical protein
LADIYLPDAVSVIYELHSNDLLRGKVIEMSDSGERKGAFVVVEVEEVGHHIIVPIDRIVVEE